MKTGVRIIAGRLRGRVLTAPAGVRPSANRVRESLMSIWSPRLDGARVLDLFAGSGAVGIEAVSRGASSVVLVDAEVHVVQQLDKTCRALDLHEAQVQAARLPDDLSRRLSKLNGDFELIFADPPYAFDAYTELLEAAARWLAPAGEIAVEHESRQQLPGLCGDLRRVDRRRYGDSSLSFYQRDSKSQD